MSEPFEPPKGAPVRDLAAEGRAAAQAAALKTLAFSLVPFLLGFLSLCWNPCFMFSGLSLGAAGIVWTRAFSLKREWGDDTPGWALPVILGMSILGGLAGLGALALGIVAQVVASRI